MADDVLCAFDDFYVTYHGRIFGFVISVYGRGDAEDIAQETMVRAYASYATLVPDRDPWPWLVAIVRNVVRDRRARIDAVPLADVPTSVSDEASDIEERQLVRAALGRLSSSDRNVLVLRECEDLTFGELARLLGRSPNTLRQQVFRARRRLAAAYTALGGRALGVTSALGRWWRDAPAQVAAAVVVGMLAGGAPATPAIAATPRPPAMAAGPAVRGGVPTGPATAHAVPARPLQPARTARVVVAPTTLFPTTAPEPAPRADTGSAARAGGIESGHRHNQSAHGEPLACVLVGFC